METSFLFAIVFSDGNFSILTSSPFPVDNIFSTWNSKLKKPKGLLILKTGKRGPMHHKVAITALYSLSLFFLALVLDLTNSQGLFNLNLEIFTILLYLCTKRIMLTWWWQDDKWEIWTKWRALLIKSSASSSITVIMLRQLNYNHFYPLTDNDSYPSFMHNEWLNCLLVDEIYTCQMLILIYFFMAHCDHLSIRI